MAVSRHDFTAPGSVSLWATTQPVEGVHPAFLEGCDQLFMWLLVEFEVAINGAFATNYTPTGELVPLRGLVEEMHASEHFCDAVMADASVRGIDEASFIVALYDYAYLPERVGLPIDSGSDWLTFLGAYRYEGRA